MALFEKVGKRISQAGQDVVSSTKNFASVTKLNGLIAEENEKIASYYYEIGKTYFEFYSDDPDVHLVDLVTSAKLSLSEIEKYNEQIKEIKGKTNCPSCGYEVSFDSVFCNSCGTRMPERKKEEIIPVGHVKCKKCSSVLPEDCKFCIYCGSAIEFSEFAESSKMEEMHCAKVCPECGKEITDEAAFCTECGYQF